MALPADDRLTPGFGVSLTSDLGLSMTQRTSGSDQQSEAENNKEASK